MLAAGSSSTGHRNDFQRRHRGRGLSAVVDALQFLLWATAAGAAVADYWIVTAVASAVAIAMVGVSAPRAVRRLTGVDA